MEANNVEIMPESHGDAGQGFKGICPRCGDKIHVAEFQWWHAECSCGYSWNLDIRISTDDDINLGSSLNNELNEEDEELLSNIDRSETNAEAMVYIKDYILKLENKKMLNNFKNDIDHDLLTIDRCIRYPEHFPGLNIEASAALDRLAMLVKGVDRG